MRLTRQAQAYIQDNTPQTGWLLDATCGNGYDTAFLAALRCRGQKLLALDRQASAVQATHKRLVEAGFREGLDQGELVLRQADHSSLGLILDGLAVVSIAAAMFNLGYLPGGDHSIITSARSTIPALDEVTARLTMGGISTVMTYRQHPGGREEHDAVVAWSRGLQPGRFAVDWLCTGDGARPGPCLLTLRRVGQGSTS